MWPQECRASPQWVGDNSWALPWGREPTLRPATSHPTHLSLMYCRVSIPVPPVRKVSPQSALGMPTSKSIRKKMGFGKHSLFPNISHSLLSTACWDCSDCPCSTRMLQCSRDHWSLTGKVWWHQGPLQTKPSQTNPSQSSILKSLKAQKMISFERNAEASPSLPPVITLDFPLQPNNPFCLSN